MDDLQTAEIKEVFAAFDLQARNVIYVSQIHAALGAMELPVTESEVNDILLEEGLSGKAEIDFLEFVKIYKRYGKDIESTKPYREAFRLMDKDNDGYISKADLVNFLGLFNESADETKIEELLKESSLYGKDKINFQDFLVHMMKK